jgi:hypothetical protein
MSPSKPSQNSCARRWPSLHLPYAWGLNAPSENIGIVANNSRPIYRLTARAKRATLCIFFDGPLVSLAVVRYMHNLAGFTANFEAGVTKWK